MKRKIVLIFFGLIFCLLTNAITERARASTSATSFEGFVLGEVYDHGVGFTAPLGDAYYPSTIYDSNGFGAGTPKYAMWYSDGFGSSSLVMSADGASWGSPIVMTGISNAHHVQVLYDSNCFGVLPCSAPTPKYRIWFWDMGAPTIYNISSMATAESADGIAWINKVAVTQNPAAKLIQDPDSGTGWNRGTYGPVALFYQPSAANSGSEPWDYKYVMYYNGTDGGHEDTGLAYSVDGLSWSAYTVNPVLSGSHVGGSQAWDCVSATYGTIIRNSFGYHFFYSGRGQDDGLGGCAFPASFNGIGYASSSDGKTWFKNPTPIFQVGDGVPYRSGRIYTPSVIRDGSGVFRMYFSVRDSAGGAKKIGYATITEPATLRVAKTVVNSNGGTATASAFNLHVKLAGVDVAGSPETGTAGPGIYHFLTAGTYMIGEDTNADYMQSFGGDCDSNGNITLSAGTDRVCTITNTDIPPPPPASPQPSITSGGGGSVLSNAYFYGQAYPGSKIVNVLRKSGTTGTYESVPLASTLMSDDGKFQIVVSDFLYADYFFAIKAIDKDGRESRVLPLVSRFIPSGSNTTLKDILVPPTIEVTRGTASSDGSMVVLGYAAPHAIVEILVDENLLGETTSDASGLYKFTTSTASLSPADLVVKTRSILQNGTKSDFSLEKVFRASSDSFQRVDVNRDGTIDIGDWSIFLFTWGSPNIALKSSIDFSGDGKVDVSDFSILLNAMRLR
ncbi:MAG: dockerin type I domain-containing protein [Patescibacteria group bacterium]